MGRWWGTGKDTTDAALRLDVVTLAKWGAFAGSGYAGTLRWTRGGEPCGSLAYTSTPDGVTFRYTHTSSWGTGERTELAPHVAVTWTACHYGGRRPWFVCPSCSRRCRVLYLRREPACRACHGLAYESQREDRFTRLLHRARKIRARLGGDGMETPPKPPGMWWRTYWRTVEEADALELASYGALDGWLSRLSGRLGG
jgi:hypothetical protein